MKCSSRRNCNLRHRGGTHGAGHASMKCSSRRNCNTAPEQDSATFTSLNEVQLPKELQLHLLDEAGYDTRPQ